MDLTAIVFFEYNYVEMRDLVCFWCSTRFFGYQEMELNPESTANVWFEQTWLFR